MTDAVEHASGAPPRPGRAEGLLAAAFVATAGGLLVLPFLDAPPAASFVVALMPAVGFGLVALTRRPPAAFWAVMLVFASVADFTAGIEPAELVFAASYAAYFAAWYFERLYLRPAPLVRSGTDTAVGILLAYVGLSAVMGLCFGGRPMTVAAELVNFSMLGFYFPARELVWRRRNGWLHIAGVLILIGAVSALRNVGTYMGALEGAEQAWQIAKGRVATNEMLLLVSALCSAALAMHARSWRWRLTLFGTFGISAVGVVLTQYRAYYVDLALGLGLLVLLAPGAPRRRLLLACVGGAALVAALLYVMLGPQLVLILYGLAERVLSIGSAASSDLSFLNRFLETRKLWSLVRLNPVVGYGLGVEYGFFDAITNATWVKTYAHNAYLMLWYKFGVVGFGLVMGVWVASIVRSLRVARSGRADPVLRLGALIPVVVLVSLFPSTFTSPAFSTKDTVLAFTLLVALASGLHDRARVDLTP